MGLLTPPTPDPKCLILELQFVRFEGLFEISYLD
jgi:hypothetical protein